MATFPLHRLSLATCIAALLVAASPALAQQRVLPRPTPAPGQNPSATQNLRPTTPIPGTQPTLLPAPDEPQGETPQQLAATAQEREWLLAYLISHEGYSIHQMDQLEALLEKMSPTQIGALVMLYKQKHDRALQREAAMQAMRQQMVANNEAALARQRQMYNRINSDENAAARYEQGRLDTQQQQTMTGYFENAPYRSQPYYNPYPYQYFPAYGY